MANGYVTEFADTGTFPMGAMQPPVAEQVVSFTTTTQSSAFNASTGLIRVHADGICSIALGTNPTATTSKMRLTAGQTEYFKVPQGFNYKIAFVTNT